MRTKIIIRHDSNSALKSHPIWAHIMELFLVDGDLAIEEISEADDTDEGDN